MVLPLLPEQILFEPPQSGGGGGGRGGGVIQAVRLVGGRGGGGVQTGRRSPRVMMPPGNSLLLNPNTLYTYWMFIKRL